MPSALEILQRDREGANAYAERASKERVRQLLERAQSELSQRLAALEGSGAYNTFTAARMRATLAQVQAATAHLTQGLKGALADLGGEMAGLSAQHAVDYIGRAEKEYRGSTGPLPFHTASMLDTAVRGASSSVLRRIANDPAHPGWPATA